MGFKRTTGELGEGVVYKCGKYPVYWGRYYGWNFTELVLKDLNRAFDAYFRRNMVRYRPLFCEYNKGYDSKIPRVRSGSDVSQQPDRGSSDP